MPRLVPRWGSEGYVPSGEPQAGMLPGGEGWLMELIQALLRARQQPAAPPPMPPASPPGIPGVNGAMSGMGQMSEAERAARQGLGQMSERERQKLKGMLPLPGGVRG